MFTATASGFRVLFAPLENPAAPAVPPMMDPCAWYDAKCHALAAADSLQDWIVNAVVGFFTWFGHQIVIGIGIALPTLAAIGVIWWMCGSFVPKASWGPRLTGFSLLAYVFYILLGGGAAA